MTTYVIKTTIESSSKGSVSQTRLVARVEARSRRDAVKKFLEKSVVKLLGTTVEAIPLSKLNLSEKHWLLHHCNNNNSKGCLAPGCNQPLSKQNRTGYCKQHTELAPHRRSRKPYKYRKSAKRCATIPGVLGV